MRLGIPLPCLALLTLLAPGCAWKRVATASLADALAGSAGGVFASDDDPELVRDAAPFSLKTMEALLVEQPDHAGLLLAACSGFAQYAYAFPQVDAERVEAEDFARAEALRERALRLFLRGRDYCLRALERGRPGLRERLLLEPEAALADTAVEDVPLLYWTGAAWGGAVALGLDRPALVADLPVVRALLERALALDEDWGAGALHAAMISLEAVPEAMGGSRERAVRHFERAVELAGGASAAPYVSYAMQVARPDQDRTAFERLLRQALAIDPDAAPERRLANLVEQARARHLLTRADAFFLDAPAGGSS
jgi:predicted anti-sigma-YlaC factor YlaD